MTAMPTAPTSGMKVTVSATMMSSGVTHPACVSTLTSGVTTTLTVLMPVMRWAVVSSGSNVLLAGNRGLETVLFTHGFS